MMTKMSQQIGPEDFLDLAKPLPSYQDRVDFIDYCLERLKEADRSDQTRVIRKCYDMSRAWVQGRLSHTNLQAASQTDTQTHRRM